MYSLEKLVYESSVAVDTGSLQNHWTEFVQQFGTSSYHIVSSSLHVLKKTTSPIGITYNSPPGWREYYQKHAFHKYDPVVAKGLTYRGIFTMTEAMAEFYSPETEHVINVAKDFFSYHETVAVTMSFNPGILTAACLHLPVTDIYLDDTARLMLQTESYVFCARHQELATTLSIIEDQPPQLTPRELDVLHWIALGKTKHEIAEHLQVSTSCIKRHCENASLKLGVNNMASAVARAMSYGLIVI